MPINPATMGFIGIYLNWNLSFSYINISNPKYMSAPAIFPFAGSFVGANTAIITRVLNTQAHTGRLVFPMTIMINSVAINVSSPRYPTTIVEIVLICISKTASLAAFVLPSRM